MCRLCVKNGEGAVEYIEDAASQVDKTPWRGIAVFVEHRGGRIHPVTFELIGKARQLADKTGQPVFALFIGSGIAGEANELLRYGVDEVFVYDNPKLADFLIEPYAGAFEDFINKVRPSSILIGATNTGRSLAPRVAARFCTGLTADCTALEIKDNTDLVQIRPAFGGDIMAQIVTQNTRPQFCTVRYKIFKAQERVNPHGKVTTMGIDENKLTSRIRIIDVSSGAAAPSISDAEMIVAAGRGVRNEKDLGMVRRLANALGAQMACTRPLIEAGWFDPRLQIGLSGRTVAPKLLITVGISGSVQFVAGMQNSGFIVSINSDPDAPIFNVAHYSIIGDLYDVLPRLLERIGG